VCADRLKVTQASAYALSRMAISCTLFRQAYEQLTYDGQSMLHWCQREARWGADWLLRTHVLGRGRTAAPSAWDPTDKFVAMVCCPCCRLWSCCATPAALIDPHTIPPPNMPAAHSRPICTLSPAQSLCGRVHVDSCMLFLHGSALSMHAPYREL
jgi:hypothetical protein